MTDDTPPVLYISADTAALAAPPEGAQGEGEE